MEKIFYEIRDAILAAVPEIKWIDLDEGQLEDFETPPVDYPCLIVGFPQANYENVSDSLQTADLGITIKLGFKIWEKFNAAVPLIKQPAAFAHFAIMRKVVAALHGLPGENRSPLIRKRFNKSKQTDPKVYEIRFECAFFDNTTQIAYETVERPELNLTLN